MTFPRLQVAILRHQIYDEKHDCQSKNRHSPFFEPDG